MCRVASVSHSIEESPYSPVSIHTASDVYTCELLCSFSRRAGVCIDVTSISPRSSRIPERALLRERDQIYLSLTSQDAEYGLLRLPSGYEMRPSPRLVTIDAPDVQAMFLTRNRPHLFCERIDGPFREHRHAVHRLGSCRIVIQDD